MSVAELAAVTKTFGRVRALDGLDLAVERGERLVLLGPNGAGKTTALRVLLGLRRPDSGKALLFGRAPTEPPARRLVGATPQELGYPMTLRVREIVDLVRAHYASPLPFDELARRFELGDLAQRQAGGLSGGEKRRVACALAFAGDPQLVVLDEPSAGLDVDGRMRLWDAVRSSGTTVILTTHSFEEAEALATRIVIIHDGRAHACNGDPRIEYADATR